MKYFFSDALCQRVNLIYTKKRYNQIHFKNTLTKTNSSAPDYQKEINEYLTPFDRQTLKKPLKVLQSQTMTEVLQFDKLLELWKNGCVSQSQIKIEYGTGKPYKLSKFVLTNNQVSL